MFTYRDLSKIEAKEQTRDLMHDRMEDSLTLREEMVKTQGTEVFKLFLYFEERLSHVLENHLKTFTSINLLSRKEKQMIFDLLWSVNKPVRVSGNSISDAELQMLDDKYQQFIFEFRLKHEGKRISVFDYNVLAAFYHVLYHRIKGSKRRSHLKEVFELPILEGVSLLKKVPDLYSACFAMLVSRINDPRKKYYAFDMKRADQNGQLNMVLTPEVSVYWARQESMLINRACRSVYKLAKLSCSNDVRWLSILSHKLPRTYKCDKKNLNLYVQVHALNKLKERLNEFDSSILNDILNLNTFGVKDFIVFKNNLLLPVRFKKIKLGYWVCDVVENKVVIRTFRFITHSSCPEGDRLLSKFLEAKLDINSRFSNDLSGLFKVEDHVRINLLKEVGLASVLSLKDCNLNIDAMQEANYEEFLAYIKQGEEAETRTVSINTERLDLQNQSLGKLLKLLLLNSLGLVAVSITKVFYVSAHKIKSIFHVKKSVHSKEDRLEIQSLIKTKQTVRKHYNLAGAKSKIYENQAS